jgi:putative selenate reductase
MQDFADSGNPGFLKTGADTYKVRLEDKSVVDYSVGSGAIPDRWISVIETVIKKYGYFKESTV